jgi:hypothetical protein
VNSREKVQNVCGDSSALSYLGQPFSADELARIDEAIADAQESEAVKNLQSVLDPTVPIGNGFPVVPYSLI